MELFLSWRFFIQSKGILHDCLLKRASHFDVKKGKGCRNLESKRVNTEHNNSQPNFTISREFIPLSPAIRFWSFIIILGIHKKKDFLMFSFFTNVNLQNLTESRENRKGNPPTYVLATSDFADHFEYMPMTKDESFLIKENGIWISLVEYYKEICQGSPLPTFNHAAMAWGQILLFHLFVFFCYLLHAFHEESN